MISEFDLIARFFTRPAKNAVLGVGDDAALIGPARGMQLAASIDTLVCGRHFYPDADPAKLGAKALAVNLSDMAAMGARPRWCLLALTLPEADEQWLKTFAAGFFAMAKEHGVALIGGDTTRGPLAITVQIMGEVPERRALRRSGARPGEDIWVSGELGGAACAVAHLEKKLILKPGEVVKGLARLHSPAPRVELGIGLRGIASSAIDISDGLLADLGHILERSKAGAEIQFGALPLPAYLKPHLSKEAVRQCVLAGGDDYELCFTAPVSKRRKIEGLARHIKLPLTRIGRVTSDRGLKLLNDAGTEIFLCFTGFDHFRD